MAFVRDLFISYAHDDLDWSRKLNDALSTQYTTFFDQASLRAGDDWENEIQTALEGSQHLIILWSDHARASDWVSLELHTFMAKARPKADKNRRLIFLNLKGANQAFKAFQQITRREIQDAYPDVSRLFEGHWQLAIQAIQDGLHPDKRPLSVPVVALTLDDAAFGAIDPQRSRWLKDDLGLDKSDLKTRYGATRAEWRPFASDENITDALDRVRTSINMVLEDFRVDWRFPDPTFWTDLMKAHSFVEREFGAAELSVLIVDPVAIYNPDVNQRLMLFLDSMTSHRTVIVILPPFGISSDVLRLRTSLLARAVPYFNEYFQPAVPPKRRILAHCAWNVSDIEEVQRQLLAAAGQFSAGESTMRSPFLKQGPGP